jgi:competence protein ComEC
MSKKIFVFVSILSILLVLRIFLFFQTNNTYKDNQEISFNTNVLSEPKVYKTYQSFSVSAPNGEVVYITTDVYPIIHYQDNISISGSLENRLLNNKIRILSIDNPQISFVKNNESQILAVVKFIRQKIISVFQSVFPKDLSSLMLGIVFGIKTSFSQDFLESLRIVGVMHVIAASGMNVTMVGGFLYFLFISFLRRQVAIILTIFGILFYAILAGFEPSIVRASIMGIIAFSSQILGRQKDSFYALILTGFVMLFISPKLLVDIGFQLSFLSTLGILFIPNFFKNNKNPLFSDFLTTFSAQIATLPILLSSFGTYSVISLLVNTLVLWTIPFLMIIGGVGAVISFVFEPIARLILYLCLPLLYYFEWCVRVFSQVKLGINIENIPIQLLFSYYLFLASIIIYKLKRNE